MNGAQFRTCLDAMFSFPFISPIRDIPGGTPIQKNLQTIIGIQQTHAI